MSLCAMCMHESMLGQRLFVLYYADDNTVKAWPCIN